ncbi:hypothetical protein LV79_002901 [Actinokineospora globicatena]|nr:hypothetical protein [Actinokineospora globicatena]MCP2303196.1 hypothetical protein [Actinokineospora globicatena]GLW79683.1 hypothetical protein Aglo01_41640 [Actinokineospora globicatena]GLW85907.1 hypothetical protein Aglo02_35470 [Actinokineospora globicatena]
MTTDSTWRFDESMVTDLNTTAAALGRYVLDSIRAQDGSAPAPTLDAQKELVRATCTAVYRLIEQTYERHVLHSALPDEG